jgi:hypothetical protein
VDDQDVTIINIVLLNIILFSSIARHHHRIAATKTDKEEPELGHTAVKPILSDWPNLEQ